MSFSTTIGSFIGTNTGRGAAYAKHAVMAAGVHSANLVVAAREAHTAAFAAKDAELAARREAMNAAAIARGPVKIVRRTQKKLATA